MKKVEIIGSLLTLVWLIITGVLIYFKWESTKSLGLNEWGDFLSGMTAPLAFLWLIICYMLQRQELKNNTDALMFQKEELSKQSKELAIHSKHLEASVRAQRTQATAVLIK